MEKLKKDVVLFDLDGTIIDSMDGIINAVRYCFEKTGRQPVEPDEFLPYIGPPIIGTFQSVYKMTLEEAEKTMEYYHEYYNEKGWKECRLYNSIEELLAGLKAKGKITGLATNKPKYYAERILKDKGIDIYFDYIGGADLKKGITNKALVIEDCLKELKVNNKDKAVLIGDRRFDTEGAAAAGIESIGVTYGYGSRKELEDFGAVVVVDTAYEAGELF